MNKKESKDYLWDLEIVPQFDLLDEEMKNYIKVCKDKLGLVPNVINANASDNKRLKTFVNLKQSKLELLESLEQLRALEAGMNIFVGKIDEVPIGVDNLSDYQKASAYINKYG